LNRQIVSLFGLVTFLFAILVVFTSRWSVFEAESLEDNTANRRPLLEEQRTPRGLIFASDGTRLVRNKRIGSGPNRRYVREYPLGDLFGHPVGYSFITQGQTGIERYRNDQLTGQQDEFTDIVDQLTGGDEEGFDVRTTLDTDVQRLALQQLGGRKGAVVALEPKTGRVRVMASVPTYDPNSIPDRAPELNKDPESPLVNRPVQGRYPPGSTMKVVTAVAAIDSGKFTKDSVVSGKSPKTISGAPLSNCCGEGTGDFGPLSLTQALTQSVNTVWAEVAEKLGEDTMVEYMKRFGFYDRPELDYPRAEMEASGVYSRNRLTESDFDVGRVAIGQGGAEGQLLSTPLQMALVAAAVGNGGKLMKPRLTDRVVARDGRVKEKVDPAEQSEVMSAATASTVAAMMKSVVDSGTATAAKIPNVAVAGKTGTAEVDSGRTNQAWFIGFAPVEDPEVAVAVTIERTQGQGGTVAAPIAKRVMEALLRG
jgi:peptidoglycan glycosyltransferase